MLVAVLVNHGINSVHIRNRYLAVLFDENPRLFRLHPSEKAEID